MTSHQQLIINQFLHQLNIVANQSCLRMPFLLQLLRVYQDLDQIGLKGNIANYKIKIIMETLDVQSLLSYYIISRWIRINIDIPKNS